MIVNSPGSILPPSDASSTSPSYEDIFGTGPTAATTNPTDIPLPADLPPYDNSPTSLSTNGTSAPVSTANNSNPPISTSGQQSTPLVPTSARTITANIIMDYDWTFSENPMIKLTVPYIKLYEKKLLGSALINNLIYGLLAVPDIAKSGSTEIQNMVSQAATSMSSSGNIPEYLSSIESGTNSFLKAVQKGANNITNNPLMNFACTPQAPWYVDAYKGLYMAQSTGFVYIFPYLSNMFHDLTNNFGQVNSAKGSGESLASDFNNIATKIESFAGDALNLLEPGVYIEKSQFYNFENYESAIQVQFHLLNTKNVNAIVANYDIINRMISKNKPFRQNRAIVDPPLIYEVSIPGVAYYPYAYIRKLSVHFIGNRRMVPVMGKNIIIPDAYEVIIELQPLTTQAANYMLAETAYDKSEAGARAGGISDATSIMSQGLSNSSFNGNKAVPASGTTGSTGPYQTLAADGGDGRP